MRLIGDRLSQQDRARGIAACLVRAMMMHPLASMGYGKKRSHWMLPRWCGVHYLVYSIAFMEAIQGFTCLTRWVLLRRLGYVAVVSDYPGSRGISPEVLRLLIRFRLVASRFTEVNQGFYPLPRYCVSRTLSGAYYDSLKEAYHKWIMITRIIFKGILIIYVRYGRKHGVLVILRGDRARTSLGRYGAIGYPGYALVCPGSNRAILGDWH